MRNIKNILLFLLPLLLCGMGTSVFIQHQHIEKVLRFSRQQEAEDSARKQDFYQYTLSYGNYVEVPLKKEMTVTDSLGRAFRLGQLLTGPRYIFHFDETNCMLCVEKFLPWLQKIAQKAGKGKVLIIGSFGNPAAFFEIMKGYAVKDIPLYCMPPACLAGSRLSDLNAPFIFETDSQLSTRNFYIPEKSLPELTERYCNQLTTTN